jgi:hypothetical protein
LLSAFSVAARLSASVIVPRSGRFDSEAVSAGAKSSLPGGLGCTILSIVISD